MYRQIMVPVDGSEFSAQALAYALGAARRMQAVLHFVRVHIAAPAALNAAAPWSIGAEADKDWKKAEAEYLEKLAALPRASGLRIQTALLDGPVADALDSYVRAMDIDLVIMTTHGRSGLQRLWLGSVADDLVRNVDVPVLLLRPSELHDYGPSFGVNHIVIPVDGTEFSERVIEHAVNIGSLMGARYTLLHIVPPPIGLAAEVVPTPSSVEFEELRSDAQAELEALANRMRERDLDVRTAVVVHSQTATGILAYAQETRADLIAMATHGRSGWTRMALGSVADGVLRGTRVPVSVMRPEVARIAGVHNTLEI